MRRERIKTLDFSYNPQLTSTFYQGFSGTYLSDEGCTLSSLILEGNKLGDANLIFIGRSLANLKLHLSKLNLSKNDIGDLGFSGL